MRAWIDATNGAAGDMLLAAFCDAGADRKAVAAAVAGLDVEPIGLAFGETRRHGFRAARVEVDAPRLDRARGLAEIVGLLAGGGLVPEVRGFAEAVFTRLARAEARVHGVGVEEVHFHEVGALDAIADIVGCAAALHDLDLLAGRPEIVVSPVAVGSGRVRTAHGVIPVPGPAVLELLTAAGAPIAAHPAELELCTPTGAALLAEVATRYGSPPPLRPLAVGVGAGTADPDSHPNIVRVLIGRADSADDSEGSWQSAALHRVDTTVDDLDPRIWPDLLDELRTVGAADAWCVPVLMRKGRPGQQLSVLVSAELLDTVCRLVFEATSTLGVRVSAVSRRSLRRDQVEVAVGADPVRVKRGWLGGRAVTVQPEYDDALAAARAQGRAVADIVAEARSRAVEASAPGDHLAR